MKKSLIISLFCLLVYPTVSHGQTEFSGIPDSYRAEWAALRPQMDSNIEKYRKGDAEIELVDAEGKPIKNIEVSIQQKSHEFSFGCNILWLGQLGEKNEAYENAFVKLFNLATTTTCLSEIQPVKGEYRFEAGAKEIYRRPPIDRVLNFCKKHDIKVKGQPLLADSWHPVWAKDMSVKETHNLYKDYFKTISDRYGKDFYMFDVTNESFLCEERNKERGWDFPLYTKELPYAGWAFEAAKPIFPKECMLTINEYTGVNTVDNNRYFNFIKNIFDTGRDIDGIGFQFHFFKNYEIQSHIENKDYKPTQLLANYNQFQAFHRPLYITEITIPTTLMKGKEGEMIQAEVVSNLYRLWFSVPAMAGITYWNLCDAVSWKKEGEVKAALLDENMMEKPAYQALYQLIKREWNTRLKQETDNQGKINFRGFYGKYDVKVTVGDQTKTFEIDLLKDGQKSNRLVF